jgi:gliding motility-associated-like protein
MFYKIVILFLLLNYQANSQNLPDNFNLIPDWKISQNVTNSITNICNDFQPNCGCWIGVSPNKNFIYNFNTLDTFNYSEAMCSLSGIFSLTIKTKIAKYKISTNQYIDTNIDNRNYTETKLIKPLLAGKKYYISFYIGGRTDSLNGLLGGNSLLSNLGFYFSKDLVNESLSVTRLNFEPQINLKDFRPKIKNVNHYKKYTIPYIASGEESYLTIGNFDYFRNFDTLFGCYNCGQNKNDTISNIDAFISIDDIVLVSDTINPPINILNFAIGNDTTICNIDTLRISAPLYYNNYYWNTGETTSSIIVTKSGQYYCNGSIGCGMNSDSIFVSFCKDNYNDKIFLPNAFTPNKDSKNDNISFDNPKIIPMRLTIMNRFGEQVYMTNSYFNWDGYYKGLPCDQGIYFYSLTYKVKNSNEIVVKNGDITLLK